MITHDSVYVNINNKNIIGGNCSDAKVAGEIVANDIIKYFSGTKIKDIPFKFEQGNSTYLNEKTLKLFKINIDDINIYENYASKLTNRYENFDYSSFKNSKHMYESILVQLQHYEKNNQGRQTNIHGDPVFTNIIINEYGKIKFIDMRGKIGDTLTIGGDWLYDWAKIYQSLIGYDEILLSKSIENKYKENMIDIFKNYFIDRFSEEDFENLKVITKSLLFTLMPLHNNEKCIQYYNLLFSIHLV